jgi:hypothetical protein
MNTTLVLSSLALVSGGLLLVLHALARRREPLAVRLARIEGAVRERSEQVALPLPDWLIGLRESYERDLRRAGGAERDERALRRATEHARGAPGVLGRGRSRTDGRWRR